MGLHACVHWCGSDCSTMLKLTTSGTSVDLVEWGMEEMRQRTQSTHGGVLVTAFKLDSGARVLDTPTYRLCSDPRVQINW